MPFELPPLPYAKDALAPHMSEKTLDFHHGKHHQTYVNTLNQLIEGTENDGARSRRSSSPPSPARRCSTTPARTGTTASSGTA